MRHSRALFILAVLIVGAVATGFVFQGGQYPKLRGDRLTIDTGGDGTAVVLTQQAGPTLNVDGSLVVQFDATVDGNVNSWAHTVDGQGLEAFLMRLQNPAPNNAKMIEFRNYLVLDTNYWLYMDANNQWDTEGELLTTSLGVNVIAPARTIEVLDASDPQLRLTQADGTAYADLRADSNGHVAITSSLAAAAGVYLGVDDTQRGYFRAYGHTTGEDDGGGYYAYTAADSDGSINYFVFRAVYDDLCIGPDTDADSLKYDGGATNWIMSGSVADYEFTIFNDGNNVNRKGLKIHMGVDDASASTVSPLEFFDGDGGALGGVNVINGVVGVHSTSDQSLKDHITTTTIDARRMLNQVKVRDFRWKSSGTPMTGFIAQELEQVYPRMVFDKTYTRNLDTGSTVTLKNADGTSSSVWQWDTMTTTTKMVRQTDLIPLIVRGFQQQDKTVVGQGREIVRQQATIEMLTGEVADLWAENANLRNENQEFRARLEAIEAMLSNSLKESK